MATNVGNLNVRLTLSAEQFAAAMTSAGGEVSVFAKGVQATAQQTVMAQGAVSGFGTKMQRLAPVFNQASFGAADFASQLSTRGLGGALSAASNNIQVMGATFGPWGLAISAATGLAVQAIGSYLEFQGRAEKNTKASTKKMSDNWRTAANSIRETLRGLRAESAEFAAGLETDIAGGFGDATADEQRKALTRLNADEARLLARREQALKEFDAKFQQRFGDIGIAGRDFFELNAPGAQATPGLANLRDIGFTVTEDLRKEAEILDKQLLELDQTISQNSKEYVARTKALKEADAAERANARQEEIDAERQAQERARAEERSRFEQQLATPFDRINEERARITSGFAEGIIDEAERNQLIRTLDVQEKAARRQQLEDQRRSVSATDVQDDTKGIEKNTQKTATETANVVRSVDRLGQTIRDTSFQIARI